MNTTISLYQLAKAFQDAAVSSVFSENDLICVINAKQVPYYVSLADNALAAYKGERGLRGYLEISFSDDDLSDIEYLELQHQQQCLLMLHEDSLTDLEKEAQQAILESKVSFAKGQYPSFHSKAPYAYIVPLSKEEEEDLVLILRALLYAKEYFSEYKKTDKNNSFFHWLEKQGLDDVQRREYLPTIKADGDSFIVTAEVLDDEAYGVYYPQAFFTDEERQLQYKRLKPKAGKIFYIAIGVLPNPVLSEKDRRIIFPMYQVVYDPVADQVLDLYMVEDYEQEHGKFIARLLEIFDSGQKPQAIHCYSKRAMALLSQLGKQIGIMIVEGVEKERMQELLIEMFEEVSSNHHHDES
ncbi:MAG: hypothetical protein EOM15_02640 [Spirochaetia bacterium]|nr:hypothetical protein [Spirochaetia bacterium]